MANKRRNHTSDDNGSSWSWSDSEPDLERHGYDTDDTDTNDDGGPSDEESRRRRAEEKMNRQLSNDTQTKRPLEKEEIDNDRDSSAQEWVKDVKQNREALNERLRERDREWEEKHNSSDGSQAEQEGEEVNPVPVSSSGLTQSHIPRTALIVFLFVAITIGYLVLANF